MVVMPEVMRFNTVFHYDLSKTGITVPVQIEAGGQTTGLKAKVDTGASCCIFARFYGEEIGLDIESGVPERIGTATGSFPAFGHEVRLSVLGLDYDATVYFAEDPNFRRNVLGRQGWLDRIRLGLIDYDGKLYLSDYNDPTE
jgi:hypothetical protein